MVVFHYYSDFKTKQFAPELQEPLEYLLFKLQAQVCTAWFATDLRSSL